MEWFIIALTLTGLVAGGHYFVTGAAAIGRHIGMSPALTGATIVAFGTSLPEWGVSVAAAWQGHTDLSVGNVVGSNVCNVCLILGLAAIVSPMQVARDSLTRDGILMLVATALLLVVCAGGMIHRVEGGLLLAVTVLATAVVIVTSRKNGEATTPFHWWDVPRSVLALVLVLVSSRYFVEAAGSLARRLDVSEWTIGITVAAVGTSLPELVASLAAVMQKRHGMVIGNVLGSNTFNILFVLGTAASIQPIGSAHFSLWQAAIFAALMALVVGFLWTSMRISRWEGAILLALGSVWYLLDMLM
jgi:cation:H+ antiporter